MKTQFRRNVSRKNNVNSNAPGRLAAILFQINLCRTVSGLSPLFLEQNAYCIANLQNLESC